MLIYGCTIRILPRLFDCASFVLCIFACRTGRILKKPQHQDHPDVFSSVRSCCLCWSWESDFKREGKPVSKLLAEWRLCHMNLKDLFCTLLMQAVVNTWGLSVTELVSESVMDYFPYGNEFFAKSLRSKEQALENLSIVRGRFRVLLFWPSTL